MTMVQVVNLSYVEFDPEVDQDVRLDTRARFVLGPDGRVRVYSRTENFRDHVLPELIGGGLPNPQAASGGVELSDGRQYLDTLRRLIDGSALTTSDILEMDEAEAREGFPFEYAEQAG
jgi:hypothetical protein